MENFETVEFGRYLQNPEKSALPEPIVWEILEKREDRMLLVSKYALLEKSCHDCYDEIDWENCDLRKWLNEDFLKEAFSEEEKERICPVMTDETDQVDSKRVGRIQDRVFLLSELEAEVYFPDDESRVRECSLYAGKNGLYSCGNSPCLWWLRTKGSDEGSTMCVLTDGSIFHDGALACAGMIGVCPAVWVKSHTTVMK